MSGHFSPQWRLFIAAFCFFAIFSPMGNLPSDTEYSVATAQSLLHCRTCAIDQATHLPFLKRGQDGHYYSKYGIGYAILFVPVIALADAISRIFPVGQAYGEQFTVSFTNTTLAAIIIVLFFSILVTTGIPYRTALITVALIAVASPLLPYSKINHAEIPTLLLLLVVIRYVILPPRMNVREGILLGITGAMLLFVKSGNINYSAVIGCYGVWKVGTGKGTFGALGAAIAIAIVAGSALLGFNMYRFGTPFNFGYGEEQSLFTTPILTGLAGLLLSPSKSIFIFAPLLVGSLVGIPGMYRRHRQLTLFICSTALVTMLYYAKWHDWHGGWSWGPRLVIPAVLLLHLFLAEFMLQCQKSSLQRYLLLLIVASGGAINVLGSLVWYQQIYHFHHDYRSLKWSHPVTAARLLTYKLTNKPERYPLSQFDIPTPDAETFESVFNVPIVDDTIDFTGFEKYQGLAVMWDGIRRIYGIPFLWIIPLVLIVLSFYSFRKLLKEPPS